MSDNLHTEYHAMVTKLKKPGEDILSKLTPQQADAVHMAMGLTGELCGELIAAESLENAIEETGDAYFFLVGLCQTLGYDEIPTEFSIKPKWQQLPPSMILCIASGQILDHVKKWAIYQKDFSDIEGKLKNSLALCHYVILQSIAEDLQLELDEVMNQNMEKLLKGKNARYKEGTYSDAAAHARSDKKGTDEE